MDHGQEAAAGVRAGTVTNFLTRLGVTGVRCERELKLGDTITIVKPCGAQRIPSVEIKTMERNKEPVDEAKPGDLVGVFFPLGKDPEGGGRYDIKPSRGDVVMLVPGAGM